MTILFFLTLVCFVNQIGRIISQCEESSTWDTNNDDICIYTECKCSPNNETSPSVCTDYSVKDESNMNMFIDICNELRWSECTNTNDLFWIETGSFQMEWCNNDNNDCPLYCKCNETQTNNPTYYTNVDIYRKECIECDCRTRTFINGYYRECSIIDSVTIDEDEWNTWTCPQQPIEYLTCSRNENGAQTTCSNWNDTQCYVEASFQLDIGDLDWDFGGNVSKSVYKRNTTTNYGCQSSLEQEYFCDVFNALNGSHSCANIIYSAYNVKECDSYTIESYNISYKHELTCFHGHMSNFNYTQQNCTHDDTLDSFYTKMGECQSSWLAVNSTWGRYDYCADGSFFDNYEYCEYVASLSTFEYGCICESYSILYNSDNIDEKNKLEIEAMVAGYQLLIESIYESNGYCCDIQFSCDLKDEAALIEYANYIVSFDIRINDTTNGTFDKSEFLDEVSDEVGLDLSEIIIDNIVFEIRESSVIITPQNEDDVPGAEYWAIVSIMIKIGCAEAANQFIQDLISGEYSFGIYTSIHDVNSEFVIEEYEYTTTSPPILVTNKNKNNSKSNDKTELDGGAIAAIIISILIFLLIIGLIFWYFKAGGKAKVADMQKKREENKQKQLQASAEIRRSVVQNYAGGGSGSGKNSVNNYDNNNNNNDSNKPPLPSLENNNDNNDNDNNNGGQKPNRISIGNNDKERRKRSVETFRTSVVGTPGRREDGSKLASPPKRPNATPSGSDIEDNSNDNNTEKGELEMEGQGRGPPPPPPPTLV